MEFAFQGFGLKFNREELHSSQEEEWDKLVEYIQKILGQIVKKRVIHVTQPLKGSIKTESKVWTLKNLTNT